MESEGIEAVTKIDMDKNSTKLRPAIQADANQIAELENQLFPDNGWNERTIESQLVFGDSWVAEHEGVVVGYALVNRQDGIADLLRLAVTPEHRRQGLAGLLIEMSLATTPAILTVQRGNPAISLYRQHGFRVAGVIESAWLMRRN